MPSFQPKIKPYKVPTNCAMCGEKKSPKELFSKVDGNNYAITKANKDYCRGCFRIRYGE